MEHPVFAEESDQVSLLDVLKNDVDFLAGFYHLQDLDDVLPPSEYFQDFDFVLKLVVVVCLLEKVL